MKCMPSRDRKQKPLRNNQDEFEPFNSAIQATNRNGFFARNRGVLFTCQLIRLLFTNRQFGLTKLQYCIRPLLYP